MTKNILNKCVGQLDELYKIVEDGWQTYELQNRKSEMVENDKIKLDISITPLQKGCGIIKDIRRNINDFKKEHNYDERT